MRKNNLKIILLSGKAECGKDTLASFLKKELEQNGKKVLIDRFAKYIKDYAIKLGWDGKTKDEYWRRFLQITGTEVIKQDLNLKCFHAKRLSEDIQILHKCGVDTFIISDCRFRDEVTYLQSMFPDNVITIRINRLGHKNKLTEEQRHHKSETDLDNFKFDYNIYTKESTNRNTSLGQLYDESKRVLGKVLNI